MAKAIDQPISARESKAYVRLPNDVALDSQLDAEALGLLAYRATYAGTFALNRKHLSRVLQLGDAVFKRVIDQLQSSDYIVRTRARDSSSRHARAVETLHLRQPEPGEGYVFIRRREIEELGVKLAGLYIFVAARPPGQHVYVREVVARFRKTERTAGEWLGKLTKSGWIERVQLRAADGAFGGVAYFAPARQPPRGDGASNNTSVLSAGADGYFGAISWIDDIRGEGGRIQMWRDGLADEEMLDWVRQEIPVSVLRNAIVRATRSRIHNDLLSQEGLYGLQCLVAAHCHIMGTDPAEALAFISTAISGRFARADRQLNSWAYVGKALFGMIGDEGDAPVGNPRPDDEVPF